MGRVTWVTVERRFMAETAAPDLPDAIRRHLDEVVDAVRAGEKRWTETGLPERAALLARVHGLAVENAQEWVDAAVAVKRLDPGSPLVGEEWISGPYALASSAGTLSHTIDAIASHRSPLDDLSFGTAPGGRTTVNVFPTSGWDRLLLSGFSAQVWLQPGVTQTRAREQAGLAQLDPATTSGVGLVLGAGNITSIAPLDVLYELIAFNRVVILKLNPIADRLLPVYETVFAPLIESGFVRIVTGGADVGTYLARHTEVTHVHMTGSAQTHDAIVFGTGPAAAGRKAAGEPLLNKPITSELGGVSPVIIVGDAWSTADVKYQAEHVATQRLHNGGYNCVGTQVVVLSSRWKHKKQFLRELARAIDSAPDRPAYYPGSDDRVSAASQSYPSAEQFGPGGGRRLVTGLTTETAHDLVTTEYFAPVLGVMEIDAEDQEFLDRAAAYVNEQVDGTLGANVLAHPKVIRRLGDRFEGFIASLRYGTVAINTWTGFGFLTATATWGAFPGHDLADVQSGIGVVHNAMLIDRPERTVVRGPFRPIQRSLITGELSISPKPPWFVSNRTAATTARRLVGFVGNPSVGKLPAIFASALRG